MRAPGNAVTGGNDRHCGRSFCGLSFLILGSLAAIFLAGGPAQGGMGIFLAVVGMVFLLISPTRAVPWEFWGLSALILLAATSAMIPADGFGSPSWRVNLQKLPALVLPHQVTLDPRATLFWILLLSCSILIALFLLGSPLSAEGMERVALLAVLGCSVYAVVAWMSWQTEWRYPFFHQEWWMQPAYGFFPNRNQTAGFLLTGAILSLGLIYRGITGGRLLPALIAATSFAFLVSMLLLFSKSRGGVVFLVVGVLLWIAGLGRHRSRWLVAGAAVLGLVIATLFLTSESELLVRLRGDSPHAAATEGTGSVDRDRSAGDSNPFADARVSIWRDTLSMIADFPVSGTGLGTYQLNYPFYAKKSLRDKTTARHAESDWLTLGAESGLPALVLVLGGLAILMSRIPQLQRDSGADWPVRWAFLSAFFAELLHGLVDVPLHKPELGWWILLLGGMGFARACGEEQVKGVTLGIQRALFVVGGIGMIIFGGVFIRAQWWSGAALPPYAPADEEKKVTELFGDGEKPSLEQAIAECRKALAQYPLAHALYFQLGALILDLGGDPKQSMTFFGVENSLSPHDPMAPFEQGKLLLPVEPEPAVSLWEEALRRQLFLDHLPNSPIARSRELFQQIIAYAAHSPLLLARMPGLARLDPKFQLLWLMNPSCDSSLIAAAVQDSAFMEKHTPIEQGRLIHSWYERGDKSAVHTFLDVHPAYGRIAAATWAAIFAEDGQHREACMNLIDTFHIPVSEMKVGRDAAIRGANGDVPSDSLAAAKYYLDHGNEVTARRLLAEAMSTGPRTGTVAETLRLRAVMAMRAGDWKSALSDLLDYLHVSGHL